MLQAIEEWIIMNQPREAATFENKKTSQSQETRTNIYPIFS